MNAISDLLNSGLAQRIGWALLHFLWQGAIIAGLLWLALRLLARRGPQVRYAAACLALLIMAVAPVATFFVMQPAAQDVGRLAQASETIYAEDDSWGKGDLNVPAQFKEGTGTLQQAKSWCRALVVGSSIGDGHVIEVEHRELVPGGEQAVVVFDPSCGGSGGRGSQLIFSQTPKGLRFLGELSGSWRAAPPDALGRPRLVGYWRLGGGEGKASLIVLTSRGFVNVAQVDASGDDGAADELRRTWRTLFEEPVSQETLAAAFAEDTSSGVSLPDAEESNRAAAIARPLADETAPAHGLHWMSRASTLAAPALPYAVTLWVAGVLACSVWHMGGWLKVQRLRRRARPLADGPNDSDWHAAAGRLAVKLRVRRAVRLLRLTGAAARDLAGPVVIGVLRPAVLIPAAVLTGLLPSHVEAILAHELAHIRRHDYLVNLLQALVETLLFYHPAVWWVSARIRAEREHCCDDLAVSAVGNSRAYAAALAALAEIAVTQALSRPTGLMRRVAVAIRPDSSQVPRQSRSSADRIAPGAKTNLLSRIRRLQGVDVCPSPRWTAALAAALVLTGLLTAILAYGCIAGGSAIVGENEEQAVVLTEISPEARLENLLALAQQYDVDAALIPSAETIVLSGQVITADGLPLPDDLSLGACLPGLSLPVEVDSKGNFELSTLQRPARGQATVYATSNNYAISTVSRDIPADGFLKDLRLVLEPGHTARIRFLDPAGNPIPGVRLRCTQWRQKEDAGTGGPHLAKIDLVSNAEGLVQIPHVHPVFPLTVNAEGPGFEWNSRKQTWPADEVVEWPLNPALPAKGTVLDKATGQPIAGAGLWWIDSHISFGRSTAGIERISTSHPLAVSGEDGTFAVTTLPRRIRHLLFVKAEGYAGSRLADVFAGQNDLKVQLVPPLHISGTLQGDLSRLPRSNKTGVPYFGYSYTIKSNQPDFFGTTSTRWATVSIRDGVGQFTIEDLWPDEWTFHVADHEIGKMELSDKSVEGISLSLEDVPPPPSLRQVVVKLVPPSGSPPPAGLIQVSYATVKNPIEHHNLRAANMLFDFDALSGTDVTVNSFNMIGYTFDYVRHKLKAGEGPHVIEIALRPAGATYGRVLSFDGAPTSEQDLPERERISITARAVGPIGQSRSAGVGTDGRFLVGPLELGGEYELTAWRGNYRVFGGSVKIDESQPLKELVIHLVKPGTIAGRVVNRDGRPVPRYQVNLSYRETRKGHTWSGPAGLTDADGKFSFEVNPQVPGEFELEDESRRVVPVVPNGPPLEIKVDADDSRLPPISAAGTNPAPVPAVHEPAATTETTDLSLADAASPLAPVLLPDWVEHVHSMVRRERAARDLRAISQALSVYADMQPLQYPTLPQEHLKNAATQGPADDLARTNLEAAKDAPANVEPAEKLPEQALVIRYSHAGLTNINICGGRMHYDWCEQNGIRQDLSSYDQYKVDLALTDDELARLARWLTEHKILKMENKFPPGDTRSYAAAFKGNLVVECGDKREFAWTDASELPAEFEAALEGFLALARDVRNRGERKAVGAPWAELLLPGSDTTVEHAVKAASWGDRGAAIVAKATGEARDLVGGRLPEGLRVVRQSFKIASVLKGELAAEQDVTVDYHVVNKDTTQERVIRQDQEVLLLLARQGGLGGGVWIVVKALPANDDNIASMKKLLPAGTAKLPGSEPHVDERIKAGARDEKRFIIVAQAQNDAFEVVGDDMFGWRRMVRQSFKVVASIRGDLAAGKSISVDYIVSEEGTHERVIRKGEQMIWILDRTDTEFWQGLKALADTPENRRQVVLSPRFAEPGSVGSAYKPTRRTPTPATHPTRLFPAQNYEMTRRFFLQNYETTRKLSTSKVM